MVTKTDPKPRREYVNTQRAVGVFTVHAYSIVSTDLIVFDVLEPLAGHSTRASIDGVSYGYLRSRPLPADIAALPPGDVRSSRCQLLFAAMDAACHEIIQEAFPDVAMTLRHGSGTCSLDAFQAAVGG